MYLYIEVIEMKLTTKEQLLFLALHQFSYRESWSYLKYLKDHELMNQPLELKECQEIIEDLKVQQLLRVQTTVNFLNYQSFKNVIDTLEEQSISIVDHDYPRQWLYIHQPPLIVFYKGHKELLNKPLVSVIGSRTLSPYGQKMAHLISSQLVQHQNVIVSGLANGVDTIAHEAASQYKDQSTIAILPNGLNQCYPKNNAPLQKRIETYHLALSEYLPHICARKHQFVMRNRLVAGLAPIVVVIEAAKKSGSLITANYALQFNKELFVLPGEITNPMARGTNELIKAGATPITQIDKLVTEVTALQNLWKN